MSKAGFTILEVMIAVVILAIGLSALFASEAGAIRMAQKARTSTVATLLARCKMAEIEEKIAKEGWPGELLEDRDECCEDGEKDGYTCEWKVERIKLPELSDEQDSDDPLGSKKSSSSSSGSGRKGVLDSMAELTKGGSGAAENTVTDVLSGSAQNRSGSSGFGFTEADGGAKQYQPSQNGMIEGVVMNLAFPLLKPVFEEGVRRAQVVVKWKEGGREMSFDVVQYIVTENQLILPDTGEDDAGISGSTQNPLANPASTVPR
jgi:general secretion pathway protein I